MSKITFEPNASGTGVFTIASPNSNTDRTLNLPDKAGTINVGEGIDDNATTTAVTIDSSGNVGIGTDLSGQNGLRIDPAMSSDPGASTIEATIGVAASGYGLAGDLHLSPRTGTANRNIIFHKASGGTEAMRIDASGNLLVGTTSVPNGSADGIALTTTAETTLIKSSRGTTNNRFHTIFFNPNGTVGSITTSGSATNYNTSSDYRLKENVVNLDNATDRLKQIPVHRFNFIADADVAVDGFLAHEVQAIVPEAISGTKDEVDEEGNPVYQGIDQSKLVPLLVATVKELESRIAALEAN